MLKSVHKLSDTLTHLTRACRIITTRAIQDFENGGGRVFFSLLVKQRVFVFSSNKSELGALSEEILSIKYWF